ncbi:hypothetical protein [Streptomyces sp. NPDC007264]|uniref:hypothetical protein n=1 Tax=Streptomyces sp. NPDC007264 TaxID=3364777 RepID=UPI0036DD6092
MSKRLFRSVGVAVAASSLVAGALGISATSASASPQKPELTPSLLRCYRTYHDPRVIICYRIHHRRHYIDGRFIYVPVVIRVVTPRYYPRPFFVNNLPGINVIQRQERLRLQQLTPQQQQQQQQQEQQQQMPERQQQQQEQQQQQQQQMPEQQQQEQQQQMPEQQQQMPEQQQQQLQQQPEQQQPEQQMEPQQTEQQPEQQMPEQQMEPQQTSPDVGAGME